MNTLQQNLIVLDHPLVKRDMTILRDKKTSPELFRGAVKRISTILAVETAKQMELNEHEVETPLEKTVGYSLSTDTVLVPVLRAGLGMVSGFLGVIPEAKVGHIGLQRDETTLLPTEYYYKTPKDLEKSKVILLDPMLATGGSASEALNYLKKRGAIDLIFVCLVASPIGVQKLIENHPIVKIISATYDRELNEKGYILPGLGDAGDRTFGTL